MPREVWLISAVALVNRSGTMVLPFLTLWLTTRLGYGPAQSGILAGLYGVGALGGAYGGGWAADRWSARPVMGASLVAQGSVFLLLPAMRDQGPLVLGGLLLLGGLVGEAFRPATSTALMLSASGESRARAFALLRLAINLGMSLGPTVGGLLAARSYDWLFWIDGATCLAAAATLGIARRAGTARRGHAHPPLSPQAGAAHGGEPPGRPLPAAVEASDRSPWSDRPYLALLGCQVLVALVFFQLIASFPLTLRSVYRLNEAGIGLILAVNTALVALFEMVTVQSLGGRTPLAVAAGGALLLGVGFGLTPFGTHVGWLVFTVLIWTTGEMLHMPFLATVAAARAGRRMGGYLGALNLAYSLAFMMAPILGGWLFERMGPRSVGWFSAAAGLGSAWGLLALRRRFA